MNNSMVETTELKKDSVWRVRFRRIGLVIIGLLTLTMVVLSFVQAWVVSTTDQVDAYGVAPSDTRGWPSSDSRGAFLMLNEANNPKYPGNLIELLATTEPGV